MQKSDCSRFEGKNVLVMGGGIGTSPGNPDAQIPGNGQAICERLSAEGASVAVADLVLARAERTVAQLSGPGVAIEANASDEADCKRAVQEAMDALGGVDVLVCNVGISGHQPGLEQTVDDWELTQRVNVRSHWLMTQAVIPSMIERGGGSVVLISSVSGLRSGGRSMAYEVTKSAVNSVARHFGTVYAGQGIRVNALAPGLVESNMVRSSDFWNADEESARRRAAASPVGRQGRPSEIASAAAFLASEDASFVTGTCLVVDGGRTALAVPL